MVKNIKILREFLEEEGHEFRALDALGNLLEVTGKNRKYFFAYTTTPFNSEDVQKVCVDKFLTHKVFGERLAMPETHRYLRPDLDPTWHDEIEFSSNEEIVTDIMRRFKAPFIVKMNSGSLGRNVFKCATPQEVSGAVTKIFEEDWALLAQEYVEIREELRVMIVCNSLEMVYRKGGGEFYSKDSEVFEAIRMFLEPLFGNIDLGWAGLDVSFDTGGKLWLFEINTRPSFVAAIREGRSEEVKALYKKAFDGLLNMP